MLGSRCLRDTAWCRRRRLSDICSEMAAGARARRAPAGGKQGRGAAPRWAATAAGRSDLPRSYVELRGDGTELEEAGRAPLGPSRFLKVQNVKVHGKFCGRAGSGGVAESALRSASHTRSSLALRKVAQLQSKITYRKKQLELQNADLGRKPLDEESFSSASGCAHGARGKKYLKTYTTASTSTAISNGCSKEEKSIESPKRNVMVKKQLVLDSDEKEIRVFMKNSLEFCSGSESQRLVTSDSRWNGKNKTPVSSGMPPLSPKEGLLTEVSEAPSLHSEDSEKNVSGRNNLLTPSSVSRNPSALHNMRSQLLSSPTKDSTVKITLPKTDDAKQTQISHGSEIISLDELFSKADDAEDSTSVNSNAADFRQNILSLDDLAPNITSETVELKQRGTDIQISQESNRNLKKDTFLGENDQTFLKISAEIGVSGSSEMDNEKTETETEISEHLGQVSSDFSGHTPDSPDHDDRTVNSEYSEDFERSLFATDREVVSKMSEEHSEGFTYSGKDPSSSPSSPLLTREGHEQVHSVTVKETGVQTVDSPFTCCQSRTNSVILGPPAGNSYIDPVPVASHVVGMDAVEALAAYRPSVLVLNAMLKQHLMLTQQFVENIRHLYLSLVESLENEKFHYHTLEEAKEFIKNHKSPSLTIEHARGEI